VRERGFTHQGSYVPFSFQGTENTIKMMRSLVVLVVVVVVVVVIIDVLRMVRRNNNNNLVSSFVIVQQQRQDHLRIRPPVLGKAIATPNIQQRQHGPEFPASVEVLTGNIIKTNTSTKPPIRTARRMNHRFRYLYRENNNNNDHNDESITYQHYYNNNSHNNMTAMEYLLRYYTKEKIVEMNQSFPPLLDLNVSRHIHPKFRFLKETLLILGDGNKNTSNKAVSKILYDDIPPHYFGARLEKIIAPRHAFLVYMGLPHGRELFGTNSGSSSSSNSKSSKGYSSSKWHQFLVASRKTKHFCALCNQWREEQTRREQQQHTQHIINSESNNYPSPQTTKPTTTITITAKHIEAFDCLFGRGILAASRNDLVQWNNTWPLDYINLTSAQILHLLISHGANPLERDIRGTTLLHWAAGTGNLEAVQELLQHFPPAGGLMVRTDRDGATPLHWAAAGATSKEFGTGGHVHVCQYLLSECTRQRRQHQHLHFHHSQQSEAPLLLDVQYLTAKDLANALTQDGNSPLMWAAWSGSLDTVKLLIRHCAEWDRANRNGCTVAHWAASGGSLDVCQYLYTVVGVNFWQPNYGGNTPLTHAVAFGRVDIVHWLRDLAATRHPNGPQDDLVAAQLAADFVRWNTDLSDNAKLRRQQVLELFQNDYWDVDNVENTISNHGDDDG
jgi:ankyrin repeat protein